ncbi:MAG TPA: tetratricopeptide repeat protein [Candidatus Hydrogenedentes bacterium]|nr:tetratricopeptide repeat protein [Candidatus Hydrogenedentota bacterium]
MIRLKSCLIKITMAVAMVIFVAGCATSKDQSKYMRDGVQYGQEGKTAEGKKQGSFRGRWWNYYVRGRSYLDGQFYAEAEEDLRTALAKRTKDQRWARTYGLHFIPEYFPNRELGIVLFNQDKFEEAIPYLEQSNQQTPSARAAYYLDQARATLFSSTDQSPPRVTFATRNVSGLRESSIILTAQATDDTFVTAIRIGDDSYPIQVSGKTVDIEVPITLSAGTNTISITATDISGKEATYTLDIATDHEGPAISFDRPITIPGTLTGAISDPAGIDSLKVAGVDAVIASGSDGTATFSVAISTLPADNRILFTAMDDIGNETNGRVLLGGGDTVALSDIHSGIVLANNTNSVQLPNGLTAVMRGGKVAALTLAANETTLTEPKITVTNAYEGQKYRLDEIILGMLIQSPNPIDQVVINGVEVANLVPGRKQQTISRRIPLPEDKNTVKIEVVDTAGQRDVQEITILRELTDIHLPMNRLNLAILGNVWAEGTAPDLDESADFITRQLKIQLSGQNRFRILDDEDAQNIADERELTLALGDKQSRQAISQRLLEAEVLVIGKVHRSFDSIEVVLEAIDPVTSTVIGYADVAGPNDTRQDLQKLTGDLALRFRQLFPVAQGEILRTQGGGKVQTTLNQSDGVSKNLRCIVYRRSPEQFHEDTGESLGFDTKIIANGYLNDVKRDQSVLSILSDGTQVEISIEDTDLVITK